MTFLAERRRFNPAAKPLLLLVTRPEVAFQPLVQ
jgi:hypothetical protein